MELKDMTIEQLKALGFDEINRLEQAKQNLQIIGARIQELQRKPPEPPQGE